MINPVLILTHNNLDLTKRCVESIYLQTVPAEIYIYDNGSTDGTEEWLVEQEFPMTSPLLLKENLGVSYGWNHGLNYLFNGPQFEHALVVGNDTVLAPWTYSALLSADVPFVTGVDVGMNPLPEKPDVFPMSPHPDFSCFLIRRECWEKVGPFEKRMVSYAQDCDYHVRAHRLGIPLWKASVPYNHERSSTMNRAAAPERHAIQQQANRDRQVFRDKYGCLPGTKEYEALFG